MEHLVSHPNVKTAAVTDHDTVQGLDIVRKLAKPYPDILIIPGVEIATNKGDIVVLGTEELPTKPWTVESIVDFAKETACVSIAVHPFREWGLGEVAGTSGVDAIEVTDAERARQRPPAGLIQAAARLGRRSHSSLRWVAISMVS